MAPVKGDTLTLAEKIVMKNSELAKDGPNVSRTRRARRKPGWKAKDELFTQDTVNFEDGKKAKRTSITNHADIEQRLLEWYQSCRAENMPLTGRAIRDKAKEYAVLAGRADFRASNGWLYKFKARYDIVLKGSVHQPNGAPDQTVDRRLEDHSSQSSDRSSNDPMGAAYEFLQVQFHMPMNGNSTTADVGSQLEPAPLSEETQQSGASGQRIPTREEALAAIDLLQRYFVAENGQG